MYIWVYVNKYMYKIKVVEQHYSLSILRADFKVFPQII